MARQGAIGITLFLGLATFSVGKAELNPKTYAGSDRCAECHAEKYKAWQETFHATVVQNVRQKPSAIRGDFKAQDLGFTLQDVEFAIGGHRDQRYMKRIGDDYYVLPKLWNVQARAWRAYNAWSWKKVPYGRFCRGCHVTGYAPERKEVVEDRVGCEACHGPGKDHADAGGKRPIVNPRRLGDERREMICAACHVRGTDPTGVYAFPVGFNPGEDLGAYYVPSGKADDETNSQAILGSFDKWKKKRDAKLQAKCDVCVIPGGAQSEKKESEDANTFCFGCHDFKTKYAEHTRHAVSTTLACTDCHLQQTRQPQNSPPSDIHSYGYFLVHAEQCYDPRIANSCVKCHKEKGIEWARDTAESWRRPVEIEH